MSRVGRSLGAVALTLLVGASAVASESDVAALLAAARPAGGWEFAHAPDGRAVPYTWLVKTAERVAEPFGLATWDLIAIRSPGTPAAGLLLLERGGDADVMKVARRAGDLLVATQLEIGGWASELPVHGNELPEWFRVLSIRPALDDDVTPGAIRLLLRLWQATDDSRYRASAERALALITREQHPSGGWPLTGHPAWMNALRPEALTHLTLNDGATPLIVTTLLDAARRLDRPDLRAAAIRGANWLVAVRGDQTAWAQQYDVDGTPAGARRFEVPALATWETRHAIDALLTVTHDTGDTRYCTVIRDAVAWLERVRLAPGCWARFHDLRTGEPVYVDAGGARVTSPYDARPGYSWIGEFGIPALLARLGRADPPATGAPLPGDPGICPDRPPINPGFHGARAVIAAVGRRRPIRRLDLGPCAGVLETRRVPSP